MNTGFSTSLDWGFRFRLIIGLMEAFSRGFTSLSFNGFMFQFTEGLIDRLLSGFIRLFRKGLMLASSFGLCFLKAISSCACRSDAQVNRRTVKSTNPRIRITAVSYTHLRAHETGR